MRVKVSELHIGKTTHDKIFLDSYLLRNGKEDRKIKNTPHFKLLKQYEKDRNLDLRKTDYFLFAKKHLGHFGNWFGETDDEGIIRHIKGFLAIYDDIKNNGFSYKRGKIIVYKTVIGVTNRDKYGRPHPPTKTYEPKDYEIFEGHHRAAILLALGYKEIEVDTYSTWTMLKNGALKKLGRIISIVR
jgi:hypothetical protein